MIFKITTITFLELIISAVALLGVILAIIALCIAIAQNKKLRLQNRELSKTAEGVLISSFELEDHSGSKCELVIVNGNGKDKGEVMNRFRYILDHEGNVETESSDQQKKVFHSKKQCFKYVTSILGYKLVD